MIFKICDKQSPDSTSLNLIVKITLKLIKNPE
jgi:hypothetical protein